MSDQSPPAWAVELHLAQKALEQGKSAQAVPRFERAAGGARAARSDEGEMTATAGLAMALFGLGRAADAIGPARRAATLATQMGKAAEAALFEALVQRLEQDGGEQARSPWFSALTAGQSRLEKGDIEGALPDLERAVELARDAEAPGAEATALSLFAQSLLALQRPREALAPARRAIEVARALGQTEAVETFTRLEEAAQTAIGRLDQLDALEKQVAAPEPAAPAPAESADSTADSTAENESADPAEG